MNTAEIKQTFYKRFGTSDKFLHYTFTGARCMLLGYDDTEGVMSLSCALSMGVGMFARRLGGNIVKIQDTNSDRLFSYVIGTPPATFQGKEREIAEIVSSLGNSINSAEILYNSSIPDFIPQKAEFYETLIKSLMKVSGNDVASYKSGYCDLVSGSEVTRYPMPLTGYKIVSAYCKSKNRIKKDKRHIHHLAGENARIEAALRGLKRCDTKPLFRAMNASERSLERHGLVRGELSFLAGCAVGVDGVAAARCGKNGVIMIIENDFVDYAVNIIRNDFENNAGYQPTFCISEAM